jgi:SRSO17 transposase
MASRTSDWRDELVRWLKPFLARLGHKARRRMCPLYVSGLIGPGDRKSIQPMAERLALGDYDQLHHFIAAGVWDTGPMEIELLVQADKLVGGTNALLVIDDTAIPKKGTHSVGVAAQYASALGKTANCQTLVSLTLARGGVPVMLALRLFLPESWTGNRARLDRAGVPAEYRTARTKPELALAEVDRAIAAGVRFGCVLADAGYGMSAPFRQALTSSQADLGGRYPAPPQGLPCRCADDLAGCQARPSPSAAHPRRPIDTGRRHAGQCQMARHQLAHRHERKAQGSFCCGSRAGRGRTTAADQG